MGILLMQLRGGLEGVDDNDDRRWGMGDWDSMTRMLWGEAGFGDVLE